MLVAGLFSAPCGYRPSIPLRRYAGNCSPRVAHARNFVQLESVGAEFLANRAENDIGVQLVVTPEAVGRATRFKETKFGQDIIEPEELAYADLFGLKRFLHLFGPHDYRGPGGAKVRLFRLEQKGFSSMLL